MSLVPVTVFLTIAMHSHMNIGVRHILPIYLSYTCSAHRRSLCCWKRAHVLRAAAAILISLQAITSLLSFPRYMAYANEAWGDPPNHSLPF